MTRLEDESGGERASLLRFATACATEHKLTLVTTDFRTWPKSRVLETYPIGSPYLLFETLCLFVKRIEERLTDPAYATDTFLWVSMPAESKLRILYNIKQRKPIESKDIESKGIESKGIESNNLPATMKGDPTMVTYKVQDSPCLVFELACLRLRRPACGACGRRDTRLASCIGCREVSYCNAVCQRQEWKRHKKECASLALSRRRAALQYAWRLFAIENRTVVHAAHDSTSEEVVMVSDDERIARIHEYDSLLRELVSSPPSSSSAPVPGPVDEAKVIGA